MTIRCTRLTRRSATRYASSGATRTRWWPTIRPLRSMRITCPRSSIAAKPISPSGDWELTIDGDLFVSFEYARARLQADRTVGWTLAGVLLATGVALLWVARRLSPAPPGSPLGGGARR
jgi:hypothetical protein